MKDNATKLLPPDGKSVSNLKILLLTLLLLLPPG